MPENDDKTPKVDPNRTMRQAYPANSKTVKPKPGETAVPEKKITPIEGLSAVKAKPSIGKRIRQAFTGDDARSVGDYLIFEVALPALKTTIYDLISQGVNRALFGQGQGVPGANNRRPGVVNYNQISRTQVNNPGQSIVMSQRDKATHNFDSVVLNTRTDAETVLQKLIDVVEQYNMATISDLYELVGVTGSFADDRWGWFDLSGADITPVRGGFVLDLPQVKPIS